VCPEEEKISIHIIDQMLKEGTFLPSSITVGSPILLVPKAGSRCLQLCVDFQHHNNYTKKENTLLPIMSELQYRLNNTTHITPVDLKPAIHLIQVALGLEQFTAFRTKFGI
jgi:hypothetical protein